MRQYLRKLISSIAAISAFHLAGASTALAVAGDCNGDGTVTVDDLIKGVNIALGNAPVSDCPSFDANHDGVVTVDELIQAVNNALTAPPAQTLAFVVATDFQTGSFATITLD